MITINSTNDLYKIILKENFNVKQVNEILRYCLPQTAIFINDNYTPIEINNYLKLYLKTYKDNIEKPIFIDCMDLDVIS